MPFFLTWILVSTIEKNNIATYTKDDNRDNENVFRIAPLYLHFSSMNMWKSFSLPTKLCLLLFFCIWLLSGKVSILEAAALDSFHSQIGQQPASNSGDPKMKLAAHDIYKELRLRGYDYGKAFQGILESNNAGNSDVCLYV